MTDRHARGMLAVAMAALAAILLWVDVSDLSGHQFWSDGSTYYSMAWSLARDGDLRYEARDLLRVERQYGSRPQGVFLKRACGGLAWDAGGGFPWIGRVGCQEGEKRIYFAKAFIYPLAVAPFVAAFGNRGLLGFNVLCLGLTLALAYAEGRRRASPARALAVVTAIFGASVAPLYLLWLTPELFNVALIMAGLTAWRRERPLLAAVLLGLATYSKPYNLFVALPLGVAPLLPSAGLGAVKGFRESLRRGLVMAGVVIALFGVNKLATGELNYQGGERKTFYGRFPLQPEPERLVGSSEMAKVTFGNSGQWMTTDHLGPIVEGRDEDLRSRRTGPLRAQSEIRESFFRNLGYFWLGRFAGAVPYYSAAVLALLLFLLRGPRDATGWLAVAALGVSYLFYIWMIPDNWYGGGGTVGNRYFLNLLPLAVFFVPRGRELLVAGGGLLGGIVFLGHMALAPMRHSLQPGLHATRAPFRHLPAELTMLNDLSVFTESWRKKRPVGDTEGDAHKHWPADPKAYYLYFTDDGSHGRETLRDATGFWLRGGARAEVILRALEPVRRMTFRVTGGRAGDDVTIRVGGSEERLALGAGQTREVAIDTEPGFQYYDSFVHVLRFRSRRGAPGPDSRRLGSFVHVSLEVDKRPRP